ncbi:hypothetical protein NSU_2707 [Novosphingobium pentaromativorans US6-1]|uniref:Uncharacterized protein n=1 Tax=Novosphingobium pentaromativorans US6-1 TaxID=1088721 RepID=G6EED6_9SPHN|nr:hypothetical protein NSU_2707 [Novosphingobium pentaromativorans US6-1]
MDRNGISGAFAPTCWNSSEATEPSCSRPENLSDMARQVAVTASL